MSGRFLTVILGLIVAYFAVYAGDGAKVYFVANADLQASDSLVGVTFVGGFVLTFFLFAVGVGTWGSSMGYFGNDDKAYDQERVAAAAVSLACLSYLFGVFAAPFTNYGAYPWFWASKWDVLLVLALVPSTLVLHGVVLDLVEWWRRKSVSQGKVTPISRST